MSAVRPMAHHAIRSYLAARADQGVRPATLGVMLAAISAEHHGKGLPKPMADAEAQETWDGIRHALGASQNKKDPLSAKGARAHDGRAARAATAP